MSEFGDVDLCKKLIGELKSLSSADEIADVFRKNGITGYQEDMDQCAISQYLGSRTGCEVSTASYLHIRTGKHVKKFLTTYGGSADFTTFDYDHVETSAAMKDFIGNFDKGLYPDLVKDAEAK